MFYCKELFLTWEQKTVTFDPTFNHSNDLTAQFLELGINDLLVAELCIQTCIACERYRMGNFCPQVSKHVRCPLYS